MTQASTAVGNTTNAYTPWHVTTTDMNSKAKDFWKDAYGQLVNVVEHNSGNNATTTYAWDAVGNLTKITDALNNVRNFTYDGLGRRLTAQDLHASGDGTFGTWNYSYDDAGNTTQTTDPNGLVVTKSYDKINRQLTEDAANTSGVDITYTYDACTYGVGRMCTATSAQDGWMSLVTARTYNPLGLVASETKTINGPSYVTSYTYDRQGNTTDIVYPDLSEVAYTIGAGGHTISVKQREGSSYPWTNIVLNASYTPMDQKASSSGAVARQRPTPTTLHICIASQIRRPFCPTWGIGARVVAVRWG